MYTKLLYNAHIAFSKCLHFLSLQLLNDACSATRVFGGTGQIDEDILNAVSRNPVTHRVLDLILDPVDRV